MSNEAVNSIANDPLKAVADALDAAAQAAKAGMEDAKTAAAGTLPAVNKFLYDLTYKTSYAVSYGVVFSTVFVARAIPKENAIVHGFVDGARAATDVVSDMKATSPAGNYSDALEPGRETHTHN